MSKNNKFYHLTLDERRIILTGIINGSTKSSIAQTIGKDKSTIGKEIKHHRQLVYRSKLPLECSNYKKCSHKRLCSLDCPDFLQFYCYRRDRSPGACNGCSNWHSCRFSKYKYSPEDADKSYRYVLCDSRCGVNLTYLEAKSMADIIAPLIKNGLSPYQILANNPSLNICEKTLYNYIEGGVFNEIAGISSIDLRRQVSRKIPKKISNKFLKRQDRKFLINRTYDDYLNFIDENPNAFTTQMDTVYNDESNGPFIQTFKFLNNSDFLFAIYHDEKTAISMKKGLDLLEYILSKEIFSTFINAILTDRGSEFSMADAMEFDCDGIRRTNVFYCNPMCSHQKGSLENKHIMLRYILPKGVDLRGIGLVNQESLNLVLSHINSTPVRSLGGKSPLDMLSFLYPDLYQKFKEFGIKKIRKDRIILKPYLLKN